VISPAGCGLGNGVVCINLLASQALDLRLHEFAREANGESSAAPIALEAGSLPVSKGRDCHQDRDR
jgi:hypothetical protein